MIFFLIANYSQKPLKIPPTRLTQRSTAVPLSRTPHCLSLSRQKQKWNSPHATQLTFFHHALSGLTRPSTPWLAALCLATVSIPHTYTHAYSF